MESCDTDIYLESSFQVFWSVEQCNNHLACLDCCQSKYATPAVEWPFVWFHPVN